MNIKGKHYHTIWVDENDKKVIRIIDQRYLPHQFVIKDLKTSDDVAMVIKEMAVRGAPLIGVAAAFGIYLAALEAPNDEGFDTYIKKAAEKLNATRPTAVNLSWAIEEQLKLINSKDKYKYI